MLRYCSLSILFAATPACTRAAQDRYRPKASPKSRPDPAAQPLVATAPAIQLSIFAFPELAPSTPAHPCKRRKLRRFATLGSPQSASRFRDAGTVSLPQNRGSNGSAPTPAASPLRPPLDQ